VHADAITESGIDHRVRFIHVPSARRDESHGEIASVEFGEHDGRAHEPGTAIDPHRAAAVDEDIRDPRVGDERREHAEVVPRRAPAPGHHRTRREPLHAPTVCKRSDRDARVVEAVGTSRPTSLVREGCAGAGRLGVRAPEVDLGVARDPERL
jgi:hypothetical protein